MQRALSPVRISFACFALLCTTGVSLVVSVPSLSHSCTMIIISSSPWQCRNKIGQSAVEMWQRCATVKADRKRRTQSTCRRRVMAVTMPVLSTLSSHRFCHSGQKSCTFVEGPLPSLQVSAMSPSLRWSRQYEAERYADSCHSCA
jgi:hypothetical protein